MKKKGLIIAIVIIIIIAIIACVWFFLINGGKMKIDKDVTLPKELAVTLNDTVVGKAIFHQGEWKTADSNVISDELLDEESSSIVELLKGKEAIALKSGQPLTIKLSEIEKSDQIKISRVGIEYYNEEGLLLFDDDLKIQDKTIIIDGNGIVEENNYYAALYFYDENSNYAIYGMLIKW